MLHLRFSIIQKQGKRLNQVVICYVFSICFSKRREVLCKCQSNFPRFIFTCSQENTQSVHLIFILREVFGDRNQGFNTQYSDVVLLILRELSEHWQKLLEKALLLQLDSKISDFLGAGSSNHWRILVAQLNKLLPQSIFIGTRLGIDRLK